MTWSITLETIDIHSKGGNRNKVNGFLAAAKFEVNSQDMGVMYAGLQSWEGILASGFWWLSSRDSETIMEL